MELFKSGVYLFPKVKRLGARKMELRNGWIPHFLYFFTGDKKPLFMEESVGTHRAKTSKLVSTEGKNDQVIFPAGRLTGYFEMLDIGINKRFSDYILFETDNYIGNKMDEAFA